MDLLESRAGCSSVASEPGLDVCGPSWMTAGSSQEHRRHSLRWELGARQAMKIHGSKHETLLYARSQVPSLS